MVTEANDPQTGRFCVALSFPRECRCIVERWDECLVDIFGDPKAVFYDDRYPEYYTGKDPDGPSFTQAYTDAGLCVVAFTKQYWERENEACDKEWAVISRLPEDDKSVPRVLLVRLDDEEFPKADRSRGSLDARKLDHAPFEVARLIAATYDARHDTTYASLHQDANYYFRHWNHAARDHWDANAIDAVPEDHTRPERQLFESHMALAAGVGLVDLQARASKIVKCLVRINRTALQFVRETEGGVPSSPTKLEGLLESLRAAVTGLLAHFPKAVDRVGVWAQAGAEGQLGRLDRYLEVRAPGHQSSHFCNCLLDVLNASNCGNDVIEKAISVYGSSAAFVREICQSLESTVFPPNAAFPLTAVPSCAASLSRGARAYFDASKDLLLPHVRT